MQAHARARTHTQSDDLNTRNGRRYIHIWIYICNHVIPFFIHRCLQTSGAHLYKQETPWNTQSEKKNPENYKLHWQCHTFSQHLSIIYTYLIAGKSFSKGHQGRTLFSLVIKQLVVRFPLQQINRKCFWVPPAFPEKAF